MEAEGGEQAAGDVAWAAQVAGQLAVGGGDGGGYGDGERERGGDGGEAVESEKAGRRVGDIARGFLGEGDRPEAVFEEEAFGDDDADQEVEEPEGWYGEGERAEAAQGGDDAGGAPTIRAIARA